MSIKTAKMYSNSHVCVLCTSFQERGLVTIDMRLLSMVLDLIISFICNPMSCTFFIFVINFFLIHQNTIVIPLCKSRPVLLYNRIDIYCILTSRSKLILLLSIYSQKVVKKFLFKLQKEHTVSQVQRFL